MLNQIKIDGNCMCMFIKAVAKEVFDNKSTLFKKGKRLCKVMFKIGLEHIKKI